MPKLSPAFVVTLSTVCSSACSPAEPPRHVSQDEAPPPPTVDVPSPSATASVATTPEPSATASAQPFVTSEPSVTSEPDATAKPRQGTLNPRTSGGRSIMAAYQGDGCFVYLDFPPLRPGEQRVPGTAPPTKKVACPAEMSDPAFRSCRGGVVQAKGDSCQCFVGGNPPRVQPHPCPSS